MKKIISLLVVAVILLGSSCRKDEQQTGDTNNPSGNLFSIKNGVVQFASFDAYRKFLADGPDAMGDLIKATRADKQYKPLNQSFKVQQYLNRATTSRLTPTGNPAIDDDL
jgi:hypothetical protein